MPAAAAEHNILTWPLPETLGPAGRAAAAAIARATMPDPLPPVAVQRQLPNGRPAQMSAPLVARYGVRVERATIAGVPVRIAWPRGVATLGTGPVLLNLHGGGFQLDAGSPTETIPIAGLTGLPVTAVLYRLAPEHPYPAALGFFSGSADLSRNGDSESCVPLPTGGRTLSEAIGGYIGTTGAIRCCRRCTATCRASRRRCW